jgi:hypothetical protein
LVKEKELSRVLDQHNLYTRDRVKHSFDQVIKDTMAKLQPGQKMQLYSMGELLEARYPYAFAEVIQAVRRGVNLEYKGGPHKSAPFSIGSSSASLQ